MQCVETEVNFIGEQVQKKIKNAKTRQEKIDSIFKFLDIVNEDEGSFFRNLYASWDKEVLVNNYKFHMFDTNAQDRFIKSIEDDGFYIVRPPHKPLVFGHVEKLYEAFPDIKPIPIYTNLFGINHRRLLHDGIVGWKYTIVLKQNSNKNFSARSTFRVNRTNLPAKDITKKTNRAAYAKSPIRLSEIYNLLCSVSGRTLAEYDVLTRSSAIGCKSLQCILEAEGHPLELKKIKMKNDFINTNADILACRLRCIGVGIDYREEEPIKPDVYDKLPHQMTFGPYTIFDTYDKQEMYAYLFYQFKKISRSMIIIGRTPGDAMDHIWDEIFAMESTAQYAEILTDDIKRMLKDVTRGSLNRINEVPVHDDDDEDDDEEHPVRRRRGRKPKVVVEVDDESEESESVPEE